MKRFLFLALGLALAAPAPALAGGRINAPGVYDASVVYIPGISVPGGLPECVDEFAQQIYVGQITVTQSSSGYTVTFVGENESNAQLKVRARARFGPDWAGFLLGPLGGREDAITGIDVANLESAIVTGRVEGQNGHPGALIVRVGAEGAIEMCRFVGRAAR